MTETVNLGVLFKQALKRHSTKKQKHHARIHTINPPNVSGIRRVSKIGSSDYKQGFFFKYRYRDEKKEKSMQAKTLKDLYDKMQKINHDFVVKDVKKARNFLDENCNDEDYNFFLHNVLQVKE